jgi:site-specific DNA-methyltransferase (adenine-specific)
VCTHVTGLSTQAAKPPRDTISPVAARFPSPHSSFKIGRATFRFYLGDCVEVLSRLPTDCLDAVVTSPPYNLVVRYRTYDDTIPRSHYLEWTRSAC